MPISQNGQTHSNNSLANCRRIVFECVWTICENGAKRVNAYQASGKEGVCNQQRAKVFFPYV